MPSSKKDKKEKKPGDVQIQNRRARFDYEILHSVEAGLVLKGSEVKSLSLGRANLSDSYCRVTGGEAFLINFDIEPYTDASYNGHERRRDRKLLLHKREIASLFKDSEEKGLALVPLKVYFNHGKAKIEVATGRGKKNYDKREAITERETKRQMQRDLADHRRSGKISD